MAIHRHFYFSRDFSSWQSIQREHLKFSPLTEDDVSCFATAIKVLRWRLPCPPGRKLCHSPFVFFLFFCFSFSFLLLPSPVLFLPNFHNLYTALYGRRCSRRCILTRPRWEQQLRDNCHEQSEKRAIEDNLDRSWIVLHMQQRLSLGHVPCVFNDKYHY